MNNQKLQKITIINYLLPLTLNVERLALPITSPPSRIIRSLAPRPAAYGDRHITCHTLRLWDLWIIAILSHWTRFRVS